MVGKRRWMALLAVVSFACVCEALLLPHGGIGQSPPIDPGPRGGAAGAGGPLAGLSGTEITFFNVAQPVFEEVDSVDGSIMGEDGRGLGPRFNLNSCAGCHAQPATGGSSPTVNPQVALASAHGATNTVPSFVTSGGPVVEVRFMSDNMVHQLYTIAGRSDAPGGCALAQPTFSPGTFSLRIPTPLFGDGLVENVTDDALIAAQDTVLMSALGITSGTFNRASDGTIARFGWKAQNKSLLVFSGEAYNIEVGVSNEVFPTELVSGVCEPNTQPEDTTPPAGGLSDTESFASFARFLAPPTPAPDTSSIVNGRAKFQTVGCQACHVMDQTTTVSPYTGQSNVTFHPFSDYSPHDMGLGLEDGITQGQANGRQFRTAPLWGLGQRLFLLHDGRTRDLYSAILSHASSGSEANMVVGNFNALSFSDQQDILNFLRSL